MNVQAENTTAIETHRAPIMMVHLVVHVILAFLEMEPPVKVSLIGIIILAVTVNYVVVM